MKSLAHIVEAEASSQGERAMATLVAIDAVHRGHSLPPLPVRRLPVTFPRLKPGTTGRLTYALYGLPNRSVEIDGDNRHIEITLAHEIGHFFDILWLGSRRSVCGTDPRFEDWRQAVQGTKAFRRLVALSSDARLDNTKRQYAAYLLQWRELWARSYA